MTTQIPVHPEIPMPAVEEVAAGIFAYVQLDGGWCLNNTGFLVGKDGVVAVDTCATEARSRAFLESLARVTDKPVRTLINTHHHLDHTHGNYLLPAATIIGHELCRSAVIASGIAGSPLFPGVQWGDLRLAPPFVTFEDRLNVYVDDLRVELYFMGPAHTTNDIVAWVPERKVLFTGDLIFNGGTPFVLMGTIAGSLKAIERMRAFGAERIVPGHGAVCGPEVFDRIEGYLRFVQRIAAEGFAKGTPPLEVAQGADLGPYAEWLERERLAPNIHRAYSELRGEPLATPLGMPAVQDMIAFNGGEPVRCLA